MSTENLKANVQKAYDDIAVRYKAWTKPSYSTRLRYLNRLLSRLEETKSFTERHATEPEMLHILELGCGAGIPITKRLATHDSPRLTVTANDISSAQIQQAKLELEDVENVTLLQADMIDLNFQPGTFAAVIGMYSLIHLPKDEQKILIARIHEWLQPGGLFLANFGTESFDQAFDDNWLGVTEGRMFWSSWGKHIVDIVEKAGFEVSVQDKVCDTESWEGKTSEVAFLWILAQKSS